MYQTFLFLTLTLLNFACKQENHSETKSLDNFTRTSSEELTDNKCGGSFDVVEGIDKADDIFLFHPSVENRDGVREKVKAALAAVPTNLQIHFFSIGGKIVIDPRVAEICRKELSDDELKFASEGTDEIRSCWKASDGDDVHLFVSPDPLAIEHGLVRSFGFILSQIAPDLDTTDGSELTVVPNKDFLQYSRELAAALVADVMKLPEANKEKLASLLGLKALELTIPNVALALEKEEQGSLINFVFAESFDSYYCSPKTLANMQKDFNGTWEKFKAVAQELESNPQNLTASGFGLTAQSGANLFGRRLFGGFGRVVRGAGRGVFRAGRGVLRGGARVGRGVLRGGARVGRAVFRGGGRVLRGAGRVGGGIVRGAGRGVAGVGRFLFRRRR